MSGLLDDFKSEFNKPNNTLVQLILINVVIFVTVIVVLVGSKISSHPEVYQTVLDQLMMPWVPMALLQKPWTVLTYAFTHADPFHILWNMIFLYWFGRLIEEYLGSRRLIGLYILGGLGGGLCYFASYNLVPYFSTQVGGQALLGASGAALSVAVGAATLLPNYTFHLLFIGPVRIKYIVLFFVILSFFNSVGSNAGGNLAHLGGALVGFSYVKLLQAGSDMGRPIYWLMDRWNGLFRSKPPVKVSQRQRSTQATASAYASVGSTNTAPSMPDQDEVDAILDKIGRSGYESLTREEKQKLFRASQKG
ncbi:rhomboid family intramembrane serine protease [Fibrella aquatica]|jgi:membrane associated rhomboid family serine protease|uniref:rhomboid family intramembrane serine protease n=1 Tax=Fibrella aquatica TaxID=3242487 RepID=UPI0035221D4D